LFVVTHFDTCLRPNLGDVALVRNGCAMARMQSAKYEAIE